MWVGFGLRKLKRKVRYAAVGLAALGLIGFPVGTVISVYILYLLLSRKGEMVFSAQYADVVKATPHIKYRTSVIVWIVIVSFLALLLAAVLFPFFFA